MSAPSQPAAIAPESATTALYRAALGPVNIDRCLRVFARFDEAGRAGPGWNWAAALLTLNWLVFRQLWGVALVYVAAVEGLALLVLGLGRDGLARPSPLEWGLLGAIVLLGCLIPGVYGNAWLHADARRRMTRAVREARTVREACDTLARRASTRRRLVGLAVINALLAAAALGAYWGLSRWMADQQVSPVATVPAAVVPEPVAPAGPAPVPLPAPVPEPVTSTPLAEPTPAEPTLPEPVATAAPVPPAEVASGAAQGLEAALPAPTRAAALAGFAINVGLFADATNADRARTRLLDAGLPAYIQVVDFPNGQRTRVRVGPFASRALADEAALRIRALGFEAQVYRQ